MSTANEKSLLTGKEFCEVKAIVEGAETSEVWPRRNVTTLSYNRTRTTEHDWASVKYDKPLPGRTLRRVASGRDIICRARLREDGC